MEYNLNKCKWQGNPQTKKVVYDYLGQTVIEREKLVTFLKKNQIKRSTFYSLKQKYAFENDAAIKQARHDMTELEQSQLKVREAAENLFTEDPAHWWTRERLLELYKYILSTAKSNAQSQKLAAQLAGVLVEKQEVKIGLTADERAQRNLEAKRQLEEGGY